jgi:hypothetical protein
MLVAGHKSFPKHDISDEDEGDEVEKEVEKAAAGIIVTPHQSPQPLAGTVDVHVVGNKAEKEVVSVELEEEEEGVRPKRRKSTDFCHDTATDTTGTGVPYSGTVTDTGTADDTADAASSGTEMEQAVIKVPDTTSTTSTTAAATAAATPAVSTTDNTTTKIASTTAARAAAATTSTSVASEVVPEVEVDVDEWENDDDTGYILISISEEEFLEMERVSEELTN